MSWFTRHAGESYSALCAVCWAVAVVLFRKSGERLSPVALNVFKNAIALALLVLSLPLAGVDLVPRDQPARDWLILLASGVLGIGVADTLFFACLNRLGAGRSAIVDCLYSPLVVASAVVYLRERVRPVLLAAVGLMVAAILVGAAPPETEPAPRRRNVIGIVAGVASMAFMAVGIVVAKPVLERTNAAWATVVRMAGGLAFLGLLCLRREQRTEVAAAFRPTRAWRHAVPGAVIGAYVAVVLWTLGMKYAESSVAAVLNQLSNVLVLPLAATFLGERLGGRQVVAIALGFAGGVLATWRPGAGGTP